MATFYRGHRPVLKGRMSAEAKHTHRGVGEYSNWDLHNPSQIFDGFPDRAVEPGGGDYPHGISMSRWFRGLDKSTAMLNPGHGENTGVGRFRPLIYKGLPNNQALAQPGHLYRRQAYTYSRNSTTLFFQGVPSANPLLGGHAIRKAGDAGVPSGFGRDNPHLYQGVTKRPLAEGGKVKPAAGHTGIGHQHVNEYFGLESAKAL